MFDTLKIILGVDKNYKFYLIISIIFGVLLGFSEILFVFSLKEILNYFEIFKTKENLYLRYFNPIYLFLFFALLRLFISAVTYFWQIYLGNYFKFLVKKNVISYLYSENKNYGISIKDTGDLLTNISDKGSYCFHHFSAFLSQLFLISINLIFLMYIDYKLFLFSFISISILFIPIYFLSKKLEKYSDLFKLSNTQFIKRIFIDTRNILFLKISGALKKRLLSQNNLNTDSLYSVRSYSLKFSFISQIPFFLGVIIFFLIIFINKNYLNLDEGTLVIFILLFFRVCLSAGSTINAIGNIKFNFPFLNDYKKIIETQKSNKIQKNGNIDIKPENLKIKNLIIKRGNFKKEISDFSINQGQIFSILGESGTGKSTLILTLFGLLNKERGNILWNNTDVENIDIEKFYKSVSFCGTDPFLINGSLEENLYYGLNSNNKNNEKLDKLLEICDSAFLNNISQNQNNFVDEGSNFSSGQRQKIALVRALLKKPKILILDEATSNIDLNSEKLIIENILREYPDIIIIATTHRPGILVSENKIIL